ncbi:pseudouridine synthase deg1 [Parelaphostrongylus tenuis]|uniref:Pseudouridine synthase deg1 n=1 Tax=Parelaphostrongylus tenuis TaxID=148309 RepID=A0AAD5MQN4_PARTN|nr:pseudouridine synthase deg1 [Parelaphostrongylus tenuis]
MSNELRQRQPNFDHFVYSKPHTLVTPNFDDVKPVKDKFKDFADKTTAHGAKRILIAQNDFGRLFWMSLIAFFLTLFLYQTGTLFMRYKKYDKITSISIKFDQLEFPAITFCNLNPYKKSLVRLVPSIRDTMDVYDNAKSDSKNG